MFLMVMTREHKCFNSPEVWPTRGLSGLIPLTTHIYLGASRGAQLRISFISMCNFGLALYVCILKQWRLGKDWVVDHEKRKTYARRYTHTWAMLSLSRTFRKFRSHTNMYIVLSSPMEILNALTIKSLLTLLTKNKKFRVLNLLK